MRIEMAILTYYKVSPPLKVAGKVDIEHRIHHETHKMN